MTKYPTSAAFIEANYNDLLQIFDCIQVGVFITDGSGKVLLVNTESIKTGGYARENLIGRYMKDLVREGYVEESAALKTINTGGEAHIIQKLPDGERLYIKGVPLLRQETVDLAVCVELDITETIKLKELLKQNESVTKKYYKELEYLRKQNAPIDQNIIARDGEMRDLFEMALRVAKLDTTVLLSGESGTGKEVFANFIYKNSLRSEAPFIKINCAAIPESLIESELFGFERGAFTGAHSDGKPGIFELANGGTLFLDEIGELPIHIQTKFLRVLQENEIMRIGGKKSIPIDVRIIAATNINLHEAMTEGRFREDLYYRINILPIEIPPLRLRKNDVGRIASGFLEQLNKKYKVNKSFSDMALKTLEIYDWPGNVRELKNVVERLVVTTDGDDITNENTSSILYANTTQKSGLGGVPLGSLQEQLESTEKSILVSALKRCETASEAARILGINKSTMSKKIRKFGIR